MFEAYAAANPLLGASLTLVTAFVNCPLEVDSGVVYSTYIVDGTLTLLQKGMLKDQSKLNIIILRERMYIYGILCASFF